jgi:hypothetical protein
MGIDAPLPIGSVLGVAYIVAKLRRLTTYIAFSRHLPIPFDQIPVLL